MAKQDWVWMPHAAHFIAARNCQFRLATAVAGGKYIVSSVGDYIPNGKTESEDVGFGRKYETYVFKGGPPHSENSKCGCVFQPSEWGEIDSLGTNDANEAYANHIELCEKYDAMLDEAPQ